MSRIETINRQNSSGRGHKRNHSCYHWFFSVLRLAFKPVVSSLENRGTVLEILFCIFNCFVS